MKVLEQCGIFSATLFWTINIVLWIIDLVLKWDSRNFPFLLTTFVFLTPVVLLVCSIAGIARIVSPELRKELGWNLIGVKFLFITSPVIFFIGTFIVAMYFMYRDA